MQIYKNKEVQHASSDRPQRPAGDTCFRVTGFADYSETDKAGTLKANGGDIGGAVKILSYTEEELKDRKDEADTPNKPFCFDCRNYSVNEKWLTLGAKGTGGWSLNYMGMLVAPSSREF